MTLKLCHSISQSVCLGYCCRCVHAKLELWKWTLHSGTFSCAAYNSFIKQQHLFQIVTWNVYFQRFQVDRHGKSLKILIESVDLPYYGICYACFVHHKHRYFIVTFKHPFQIKKSNIFIHRPNIRKKISRWFLWQNTLQSIWRTRREGQKSKYFQSSRASECCCWGLLACGISPPDHSWIFLMYSPHMLLAFLTSFVQSSAFE